MSWHLRPNVKPQFTAPAGSQEAGWPAPSETGAFRTLAEALLDAGYSPLPIIPGRKKPALRAWSNFCTAPMLRSRIQDYAARWPGAGLGLALGYAGVIALDADTEDAAQIAAIRKAIPAEVVAKVGAKGFTAFYRAPNGAEIPSRHFAEAPPPGSAAKRGAAICDLLALGTQTVLPPSPHPAGHAYRWLTHDTLLTIPACELPEAPADIAERLETALAPWLPKRTFEPGAWRTAPLEEHEQRRLAAFAKSALSAWAARLAETPEGGRNGSVFGAGLSLGKFVFHRILEIGVVEATVLAACAANGLLREDGRSAVLATLHSGMTRAKNDLLPVLKERRFEKQKPVRAGTGFHRR